jgi:hypothetical protein
MDGHCQEMAVFRDFWMVLDASGLGVAETESAELMSGRVRSYSVNWAISLV